MHIHNRLKAGVYMRKFGYWHWFPALLITVFGHLFTLIGYAFVATFIILSMDDPNANLSKLTYIITTFVFSLGIYGIYFIFSYLWGKSTVNRYYRSKFYRIFTYCFVYIGRALYVYHPFNDFSEADFSLMSFALMASIGITIDAINNLQKENE